MNQVAPRCVSFSRVPWSRKDTLCDEANFHPGHPADLRNDRAAPLIKTTLRIDYHRRDVRHRNRQMISGVTPLALAKQYTLFDQVGQIARSSRRGSTRDGGIVSRAETSFETVGALPKHAQQRLLLPRMDLPPYSIEQTRLFQ